MHVVHLTASTLYGGPERQMLGLARHVPAAVRSTFVSFREGGRCRPFLAAVRGHGFDAVELAADTPHLRSAVRELAGLLADRRADLLLTHGYKANVLGRLAARRVEVPVVGVSRGWTGESRRVRAYEALDRLHLRILDRVVAVSDAQADKVRRCGVSPQRLRVIHNAARPELFAPPDPAARGRLLGLFPAGVVVSHLVVAAGRFSPEKGFPVLVAAAARVLAAVPSAGFVLFGDGAERPALERRLAGLRIADRVRLPGFAADLDGLWGGSDVAALASHTEGLPNVLLEAAAAGLPAVATAVGGNPEVVADGETGLLVSPGRPDELAAALVRLLTDDDARRRMGEAARRRAADQFSFSAQAAAYLRLFAELAPGRAAAA